MKVTILLDYNENLKKVEEEEKSRFLRSLLQQFFDNTEIAAEIDAIWETDGPLTPVQKVKMRGLLTTYNIQVIDDNDGHLQVFVDNELVAEWRKCTYKLKKELHQIDPKKKMYLEMAINCWSVFDSQSEQET